MTRLLLALATRRATAVANGTAQRGHAISLWLIRRALTADLPLWQRVQLLLGQAELLAERARRADDQEALRAAAAPLIEAASLVGEDEDAAAVVLKLAISLSELYAVTGDEDVLWHSARETARSRSLLPPDHPQRAELLEAIAVAAAEAGYELRDAGVLTEAVEAAAAALAAGGEDHYNAGLILRMRYDVTGAVEDVESAQVHLVEAVARAAGSPSASALSELAHVLGERYLLTGDVALLQLARDAWSDAVSVTEADDPWLRPRLAGFADCLTDLFLVGGEPEDARAALDFARKAVAPGAGEPPEIEVLYLAAKVFEQWARVHGHDATVFAEAESAARTAVEVVDEAPHLLPDVEILLASVLECRSRAENDPALLDDAIGLARSAVDRVPEGSDAEATHRSALGTFLVTRFARSGVIADLDDAVAAHERALSLRVEGDHDHARCATNLCVALCHRYLVSASVDDLHEAVRLGRVAIEGPNTVGLGLRMSNLGRALHLRYLHLGDLSDLDAQVDLLREAVRRTPSHLPELPGLLINLGTTLTARHDYLRTVDDLEEAAALLREAVTTESLEHELALANDALATVLAALAGEENDQSLLDEAISASLRSVAGRSFEDPDLARRVGNLLSHVAGSPHGEPARQAFELADEVKRRWDEHVAPYRTAMHTNLAMVLVKRGDLAGAVSEAEAAIALAGPDHPDRAQFLVNLAAMLDEHGGPEYSGRVLALLAEAADVPDAPPSVRLRAAAAFGRRAIDEDDPDTRALAVSAFERAVELIPLVSPSRLGRGQAQRRLDELSELARDAAAVHVEAGLVERAVELLELGRGVLLNRALGLRGDLDEADPGLAAEFERTRRALDDWDSAEHLQPLFPGQGRSVVEHAMNTSRERRRILVGRLDDLLDRIREVPGLSGFARLPNFADLLAAGRGGAVVLVNVSERRCDAVVLTEDGPIARRLDGLESSGLRERAVLLHRDVLAANDFGLDSAERTAADERVAADLAELWTSVAEPVLEIVHRLYVPERIWWVPTGWLALLPVHAATSAERSVLDEVVSSYAPTVTALLHARRTPAKGGQPLVLFTSHHDAQVSLLPSARDEAFLVAEEHGVDALDTAHMDSAELLATIGGASDLYAAMHAVSDPVDPSRSGLRIGKTRLVVAEIAAVHARHAVSAYLSACETSLTTPTLVDESIHLTAAFQLVGFPHVVGTLWRIPDVVAANASRWYREALRRPGATSASAAHSAMVRLRARYAGSPATWAGYLHAGA